MGNCQLKAPLADLILAVLPALSLVGHAQMTEVPMPEEITAEEAAIAADTDGSLDDADSSIEIEKVERGLRIDADVRVSYEIYGYR